MEEIVENEKLAIGKSEKTNKEAIHSPPRCCLKETFVSNFYFQPRYETVLSWSLFSPKTRDYAKDEHIKKSAMIESWRFE
jgi:hypothetical protein